MSPKMTDNPIKLLPETELRRLRMGSYEERIGEANAVIRVLLGETPFQVVATRANNVVVYSDGKFLRVELREEGVSMSVLDVESFDSTNSRGLAEREAGAIVDLFLQGEMESAVSRLGNLVPVVQAGGPASKVESDVRAPRLWRRVYADRIEHINTFLEDGAEVLKAAQLRQNFGKLYDGSIEEDKLDIFEDRVTEDLGIVLNRLGLVRDEVGAALETAASALTEATDPLSEMFARFAGDLLHDLRSLHESGSLAIEAVDDTRSRGRLCDTLVEGLYDREVAGRFVVVVANRLVEAS